MLISVQQCWHKGKLLKRPFFFHFVRLMLALCLQRSVDLNPAQRDLVLKVAELLCSKEDQDSRAEFWVEKASKLMPGSPAVFKLKVSKPS